MYAPIRKNTEGFILTESEEKASCIGFPLNLLARDKQPLPDYMELITLSLVALCDTEHVVAYTLVLISSCQMDVEGIYCWKISFSENNFKQRFSTSG